MRTILVMRAALALTSVALTSAGCGGGDVSIAQGPMPQGGSYTGVWHSPQYGEMQLVQTGTSVVGEYHKDERRGRIQGTVQGNVLRFEWSEERELVAGRPIITRGRGFFRYAVDGAGDHVIQGRWGVDNDMSGGGEWNAVRDRRRRPTISASGSSGSEDENVEEFDTPDGDSSSSGGSGSGGRGSGGSGSGGSGSGGNLDLGDL